MIDEAGAQRGVLPFREALALAKEANLDLIEVAPTAVPPVCRIMDYGKYKYEQRKRDRESHKKQKTADMRPLRVRPMIDDHDFQVKLKTLHRMLADGSKVKINVLFRAREMSHPEFGRRLLEKFAAGATEVSSIERGPIMEGRMMSMILSPKSAAGHQAPTAEPAASAAKENR